MTVTKTRSSSEPAVNPDLPPGAEDVASDYYVPPSVRPVYRRLTRPEERERLQHLNPSQPVTRVINGRTRFLDPTREDADRDLFLHLTALDLASRRVASTEADEKRRAYEAAHYTCASCASVAVPMPGQPGATIHRLRIAGRSVSARLCADCFALIEHQLRGSETLTDGRTRGDAAGAYVARLAKAGVS